MRDIIVIGGGASGMVAAITAARKGACVKVLERMQRVGKKRRHFSCGFGP